MVGLAGKGSKSRQDSLEVTCVGQESFFLLPGPCLMAQVLVGPEETDFSASFWL